MIQPPWKTVWRFLKDLNIELPDHPGASACVSKGMINGQLGTCTSTSMAALVTIHRRDEYPKCPPDEWNN